MSQNYVLQLCIGEAGNTMEGSFEPETQPMGQESQVEETTEQMAPAAAVAGTRKKKTRSREPKARPKGRPLKKVPRDKLIERKLALEKRLRVWQSKVVLLGDSVEKHIEELAAREVEGEE